MIYSIIYQTKSGGQAIVTSLDYSEIRKTAVSVFKKRLPATIYKNGEAIGQVSEDISERLGWSIRIPKDGN